MTDQEKDNSFSNLVVGVVIGAALTYLFVTPEGQKIKNKLIKEGSKLFDKVKEGLEVAEEDAGAEVSKVKEKLSEVVEDVKENIGETASEVPEHIEQLQKKGRRLFFRRHHTSAES